MGPAFLNQPIDQWPKEPRLIQPPSELICVSKKTVELSEIESIPDASRFSSWLRLIRSTAPVLKGIIIWRSYKRSKKEGKKANTSERKRVEVNFIIPELLERAEMLWYKRVQYDCFKDEIICLKGRQQIAKKSVLRALNPKLDENEILRAESRILLAPNLPETITRPMILDGKHCYTRLLISHYHETFHHVNHETVINELKQKCWITQVRSSVKSVISHCLTCKILKAKPRYPQLGPLPEARLSHHKRAFTCCGIVYFGPIEVTIGRRKDKHWGVLFTCLTSRAIHIELASSLSADSTIMALRRMAARRGHPSVIYSDNGTNLRGACAEIREELKKLDVGKQQQFASNKAIDWRFIAPHAPHMGGS